MITRKRFGFTSSKPKTKLLVCFKEWKVEVENQTGKKLKYLRTDNGLEFCNHKFDKLCKESGVKRHHTCTYTPQQNGVAERMNRTIMDKVRSMLSETGLGSEFWAEATSTAVYLINRTPNSSVDFEIPEKRWTGGKVDFSHLRRFGCSAYVHRIQEKTSPRAVKGVFVGYLFGVKGYRVWIDDEGKCTTSRNVVFHEQELYKDVQKTEKSETVKATEGAEIDRKLKKKVSFCDDLVLGPTPKGNTEGASTSGGVSSDLIDDSDSHSSQVSVSSDVGSDSDLGTGIVVSLGDTALDDHVLSRDRSRRKNVKAPSRFDDTNLVAYALSVAEELDVEEPQTYAEAMRTKDRKFWNNAAKEEIESLKKNRTWDLVERPKDQKLVGCRWIFKRKPGIPGVEEPCYKGRVVAKGYSQKEGVDYNEIFSPVVKHVSMSDPIFGREFCL